MAKLIIPTPLRKFTENQGSIEAAGGTVLGAMQELTERFPELKEHLFDTEGSIRSFVRIYVGDEDIKQLDNEQTAVATDAVISIVPAIAGGAA